MDKRNGSVKRVGASGRGGKAVASKATDRLKDKRGSLQAQDNSNERGSGGEAPERVERSDGTPSPLIEAVSGLYRGKSEERPDAKFSIRAILAARFDGIAMLAEARYRNGHPFIIKSTGVIVDKVVEYETDDGRLAIAANQAIGKMLGMDEAVKSEVTIEERPYRSLTDEELAEKARELSGGGNAK